jgi:hypothetical protein
MFIKVQRRTIGLRPSSPAQAQAGDPVIAEAVVYH